MSIFNKQLRTPTHIVTLAFVLSACSSPTPSPSYEQDHTYSQALTLVQQGQTQKAETALESIPPQHPDFVPALVELQKIRYKNSDWQKFFASAYFYRTQSVQKTLNERMLSLEALALARHCRWQEAQALLQSALAHKPESTELKKALDYIELHHEFPEELKSPEQIKTPSALFSERTYWKINHQHSKKISNPHLLRMKVESKCTSAQKSSLTQNRALASQNFPKAAILYQKNNKTSAFALIEKEFKSEPDLKKKSELALILASTESSQKHLYAVFALENHPTLTSDDEQRLIRIAADGYFDQARLEKAEEFFKKWLTLKNLSPSDQEYGTYQLGWVKMNLKKPHEAYQLWKSWTLKTLDGLLRQNLIKDMGRAWTESSSQILQLPHSLTASERTSFIEGVLISILRETTPPVDATFKRLTHPAFKNEFILQTTTSSNQRLGQACARAQRLKLISLDQIEPATRQNIAFSCAAEIKTKQKSISKAQAQDLTKLLLSTSVEPAKKPAYAELLFIAQEHKQACALYTELTINALNAQEHKVWPALLSSIEASCATAPQTIISQILSTPELISQVEGSSGLLGTIARLTPPSLLLDESDHWQGKQLPLLVFQKSSRTLTNTEKLEWLKTFSDDPISKSYLPFWKDLIQTLIQKKSPALAQEILNDYFPTESDLDLDLTRFWLSSSNDIPRLAQALERHQSKLTLPDQNVFLSLLLNSDTQKTTQTLWSHWHLISQAVQKIPTLMHTLMKESIDSLPHEALKAHSHDSLAQTLMATTQYIDQKQITKPHPHLLKKLPFASDLSLISSLREALQKSQNTRFKSLAQLEKSLDRQMNMLKALIRKTQKQKWFAEKLRAESQRLTTELCKNLATSIEATPADQPEVQSQLKELALEIRNWSKEES